MSIETYQFHEVDILHKGKSYNCSGTLQYEYTPGENDGTPYGDTYADMTVICLDEVEWSDGDDLVTDMNKLPVDVAELKESIEGYYDSNTHKLEVNK